MALFFSLFLFYLKRDGSFLHAQIHHYDLNNRSLQSVLFGSQREFDSGI